MPGLQSIQGLISSLKTDDIINAIITNDRQPAVLMEQRETTKTNEITTYKALSAKLLAVKASLAGISSEAALSQSAISVSDESLLTATADKALGSGTYTINVLSLARNSQIASQGISDANGANMGTGTITLALGSKSPTTLTIDSSNNSLTGIAQAINNANIGITATIINDGSDSRSYRLVLTGAETGQKNQISVTSSLVGGTNLNFATASFDNPELIDVASTTSSNISLGATAAYSGSANKEFTFTVAGTGSKTIGQGNITLNWTDGTNSGAIVVSQADTEVIGPEGLKLSFADGTLTGGDTFRIQTFAPVLQRATDAKISIGASDGAPITIQSSTNTIKDAIAGLTLNVKGLTTATTGPVTISTGVNTDTVKKSITSFISAYNDAMSFIDDQNKYDSDTKQAGLLMGDVTLASIQSRLSGLVSTPVSGLEPGMNTLSAIGIRTGIDGQLSLRDPDKLTSAMEKDLNSVLKLFLDRGQSSNSDISLMGGSGKIKPGTALDIDITQAATSGYLQGLRIADPVSSNLTLTDSNNTIKLRVDGVVSDDIVLAARTYSSPADLVNEIQTKINADAKIGGRGVKVSWTDLGNGGYLKLGSSSYGSTSRVETMDVAGSSALSVLGLSGAMVRVGDDVAGTINGEKATGHGQILTGDSTNLTTAGLQLMVTLTPTQVISGADGKLTITRGVASLLSNSLDEMTKAGGLLASRTDSLQKQIDDIKQQVTDFDTRLAAKREDLYKKFSDMETALANFQTQGDFLTAQLASIQSNFSQMTGNSSS
jgi:flagellar hook-associated protein 2